MQEKTTKRCEKTHKIRAQNIIILDCSELGLYKQFIHSKHFNVIACIVFCQKDKDYCLGKGIKHVLTLEEVDFLHDMEYFSFPLINTHRDTQRKIEFGMMRSLNSNMLIANKYYNALCYFERIFDTNQIDCVFVNTIPHGYLPETILLDVASKHKVPSYCSHPIAPTYSSILRFDKKKHIPVSYPITSDEMLSYLFYSTKDWCSNEVIADILQHKKLQIWLHRFGGAIVLDIASCIKHLKTTIHMGFYKNMRLIEKLYSFYRLREMKRFYKKHAITPDKKQKYIFYAVHFEPEAGTGVIMDLQNQLSVIQILACSLPRGWKLYLKEHPHQFNINNVREHFFLTNFQFFKDKSFYEELLKLSNVSLVNYDVPSEELVKHAQAIATINGSIILESTHNAKPCITFDNFLMPITECRVFKNIHSFTTLQNLKEFLQKLKEGQFTFDTPTQEQYKKLASLYFNHSQPEIVIDSIVQDLQR